MERTPSSAYLRVKLLNLTQICICQLAFSRGLSSGGNLDKRVCVDLGNKEAQDAVLHYLDVCFVKGVMLQPNCRTTGLPSYFNANVKCDTWHEHHRGDLPDQVMWEGGCTSK
eukprot:1988748-Pyramimonas_sp.AAC.1